jgi:hypothetical protein
MPPRSVLKEYWQFVRYRKKFWVVPILLVIISLGILLVTLQNSMWASILYPLF